MIEAINQKAQTSLGSLKRIKIIGIIAFVVYLIILGNLLYYAISNYTSAANYFIGSMLAITLINLKGFSDYIRHLVWANSINYDGNIIATQQQLSRLQLSIIKHTKVMVLQFPFWTTFYLSNRWFPQDVGLAYIIFQVVLTGAFTYLAYWLYKNQTLENLDKKWYQRLIAGSGGKSVMEAIDFYKEIETFRQEL